MILETDQALAAVLKTNVLGGAPIGVAFDAPSKPWIQALKAPTVNLFLYDLRENAARRESSYEEIRDADGKVVERRAPLRLWDLYYTVTVFAPQVLVEHKILAAVTRYFSGIDVLPPALLPPALAEDGHPILVSTGAGAKRGMFLNVAGDLKAGLELAVTVPVRPLPPPPPAPPVQQPPRIEVAPVPGADPARTASPAETVPVRPTDVRENPSRADTEGAAR